MAGGKKWRKGVEIVREREKVKTDRNRQTD